MTAPSPSSNRSRHRTSRRAAFTLAELIVSMASMAVLMAGIASTIVLATRTVDDGTSPAARIREATSALDLFIQDAACALTIQESTTTALAFTVPDRDGDGQDETLRYEWLGTSGDPLTRQYNGGAVVNIVEDVRHLFVNYDYRTGEEIGSSTGDETLLISHEGTGNLNDFVVTSQNWIGQYFKPSLPADATSWSVTRVQFPAKIVGMATGRTKVQLRQPVIEGVPSSTVLEEVMIREEYLGYFYSPWEEVAFNTVSALSPSEGLCLVLEHDYDSYSCDVQYQNAGASTPGTYLVRTTDAGATWSTPSGESMLFKVYGTVTTSGSPGGGTLSRMTCIHVTLRAGPDASSRIDTSVHMLNTPEVIN